MAITMTESARRHVRGQLESRGHGAGIRVGVRTSGCSGMAYVLEFVDEVGADDQVFEFDGLQVLVDAKSMSYLEGTELDFVREGINEGFQFRNPNVSSECGCGESFNV